jgi:hypothetical protein
MASMSAQPAHYADRFYESRVHSLDQLTQMVHQNFYELECRYTDPGNCNTRARATRFKDSLVSMVDTSPAVFSRTHRASSRADAGSFKIMWQIAGRSSIQQGGREALLVPGTWSVYDSTRPYSVNVLDDDSRFVVLFLPQSEAYAWGPAIPRLLGTALSGKGTAEVALSAIGRLLDDQFSLDSAGQMVVQDSVVSLIAAAMRQTEGTQDNAHSRVASTGKLEQIREFILEHISPNRTCPPSASRRNSRCRAVRSTTCSTGWGRHRTPVSSACGWKRCASASVTSAKGTRRSRSWRMSSGSRMRRT